MPPSYVAIKGTREPLDELVEISIESLVACSRLKSEGAHIIQMTTHRPSREAEVLRQIPRACG